MFRKIITSQAFRLSSQQRTLTTLTTHVNRFNSGKATITKKKLDRLISDLVNLVGSLLKQHVHKPVLYSFLHTQSNQLSATAELLKPQETTIEPVEAQRFDAIQAITGNTQKALKKIFRYDTMSAVQEAVLTRLPNQDDMFVKAKTGTGKTLAFLIAAIETAVRNQKDLKHFDGTSIMIISPTRELANQIADEAQKLVSFYPFKVHCLVGGDSKRRQINQIERNRCDIVVATPGRLYDMLTSVPRFKKMCQNLKVLVLDEADQLLDMGFKRDLQNILGELPDENRQTMLFSATISPEIRKNLGDFALNSNYQLIDTVGENEVNTHMHVKQSAIVAPYHQQFALIQDHLQHNQAAQAGKVIVFLPTTKATMLYAQLYKRLIPDRPVFELHSKKGQDQRAKIADRFRKSRGGILFTSDVSARGVDYPGVSLVVQVGVPSTREQYIHRLGRTGRAGKSGEGVIVLAPFEKDFLKAEVADLPIEAIRPELTDPAVEESVKEEITKHMAYMDSETVREVYTAYLGYCKC